MIYCKDCAHNVLFCPKTDSLVKDIGGKHAIINIPEQHGTCVHYKIKWWRVRWNIMFIALMVELWAFYYLYIIMEGIQCNYLGI